MKENRHCPLKEIELDRDILYMKYSGRVQLFVLIKFDLKKYFTYLSHSWTHSFSYQFSKRASEVRSSEIESNRFRRFPEIYFVRLIFKKGTQKLMHLC